MTGGKLIKYKGTTKNISDYVVGLVTRNPISRLRAHKVYVTEQPSYLATGFAGLITPVYSKKTQLLPHIQATGDTIDKLAEGDCVLLDKDGMITVVWEVSAKMNPLLLTEKCDCRCKMCPQPPKSHDSALTAISQRILEIIKPNDSQTICITGGEPTLLKHEFFDILKTIRTRHTKSQVMLLTNGKSFSDFEFTKQFVTLRPSNFISCVSLHSDVDEVHDRIVGVKNSFYKTIKGLHNLARFHEKIEIRVVLSRLNAKHLESIATFIYRNFPFIYHCAFMGMEITGLAAENYGEIWIDPYDYREQLSKAIRVLSRADINVSVYNLPLCLIEKKTWGFARQSISGWKNEYVPKCEDCSVKNICSGVFTTSGLYQSINICPQ